MDDNPTRQRIIMLLKKAGHMTVAELSREMAITPMAVRQHLMYLERKGILYYITKKYGIGRPMFLYKLTDKANEIFPNSYGNFLMDMLRTIEEMDGREKVEELFRVRSRMMFEKKRKALLGISDFTEKVVAFSAILEKDGFLVELEEMDGNFVLKQFNCLLSRVVPEFPEACKYELELYGRLLDRDIKRTQSQSDGASACIYIIPKG